MITNYKIVCLVQFNKIEFDSSAILALSATVVLTSLVVPVELFRGKLSESDNARSTSRMVVGKAPVAARGALRALKPRAAPWRRGEGSVARAYIAVVCN